MNRSSLAEQATFAKERAKEYVSSAGGVISKARSLVSGDALFFATVPKIDDLRHGLAADSIFDKRDAMKRIVAQMCKGADMHCLFPDVVKNVHVPSIEMRKLVYLFILNYAEQCPNEALLSISAFQRDLNDASMHVRALALRMLSSIRIPAIHPVVMVAVRKCATDVSAVVRKTAAIALRQMHSVMHGTLDRDAVQDILRTLLVDKETDVVGAAVYSLEVVVGAHEVELLHPVYRSLCRALGECEEWGQVVLLRVLLRYARTQFNDPTSSQPRAASPIATLAPAAVQPDQLVAQTSTAASTTGGVRSPVSVSDKEARALSSSSPSSSSGWDSESGDIDKATRCADDTTEGRPTDGLDADHLMLLQSAKPLLRSTNSAVVVGVCALYYHCAPVHYLDYCVKPLMRVLGNAAEGQSIVLHTIHAVMLSRPEAFVPYVREFYLLPHDAADVRRHKLRLLVHLVTRDNFADICNEFRIYMRSYSESATVAAVRGCASIALRQPEYASQIIHLLTPLLSHRRAGVVAEAVAALRVLFVQSNDTALTSRLVFRLMRRAMSGVAAGPRPGGLATVAPTALATIVWLVSENIALHPALATAAPDCFRVFVRQFASLESVVKLEVLMLGCKIWLHLAPQKSNEATPCLTDSNDDGAGAGKSGAAASGQPGDNDAEPGAGTPADTVSAAMDVVGDKSTERAAVAARPLTERFCAMYQYALELARYDEDYQVRDQARLLTNSLDRDSGGYKLLKAVLLDEKPTPRAPNPYVEHGSLELGTFSHLFQRSVLTYAPLPAWSTALPDNACRAAPCATPRDAYSSSSQTRSSSSLSSSSVLSRTASSDDGQSTTTSASTSASDVEEEEDDDYSTQSTVAETETGESASVSSRCTDGIANDDMGGKTREAGGGVPSTMHDVGAAGLMGDDDARKDVIADVQGGKVERDAVQ